MEFTAKTAEGYELKYEINDDGTTVTCTGMVDKETAGSADLVIPETVTNGGTTYIVTDIGEKAFYCCYELTGSLIIPNSVTSIGEGAFCRCEGLTGSLIIPNSVTKIGNIAFAGCEGLTGSLTISNSVTSIGEGAFEGCKGLTGSLIIPNSVTSIGNRAFNGCRFSGDLIIPDSVKTIGKKAFCFCRHSHGDLIIGNSVESIGDEAFKLTCLAYKFGVPQYGTNKLTIGNSVKTIGNGAFYGCFNFVGNLTIPNSVESIGDSAFEGCEGLTSVVIQEDFAGQAGLVINARSNSTKSSVKLNVINVNSTIVPDAACIKEVENILCYPIVKQKIHQYNPLITIEELEQIPIFLLDDATFEKYCPKRIDYESNLDEAQKKLMDKHSEPIEYVNSEYFEDEENNPENEIREPKDDFENGEVVSVMTPIGCYMGNGVQIDNKHYKKAILLCPTRIVAGCSTPDEEKYSYIKVIFHEFAHAIMDGCSYKIDPDYNGFYLWMEESLANYIALRLLDFSNRRAYDHGRKLVRKQSKNYRLGGIIHKWDEIEVYIPYWSQFKSVIVSSNSKFVGNMQAWLKFITANYSNLNKDKYNTYKALCMYSTLFKFKPGPNKRFIGDAFNSCFNLTSIFIPHSFQECERHTFDHPPCRYTFISASLYKEVVNHRKRYGSHYDSLYGINFKIIP